MGGARAGGVATDKLVEIPAALDFDRAAGICITYGTTFHALKDRARSRKANRWRCSSSRRRWACGGRARQDMGARVIACASSDDKLAFARKHGSDAASITAAMNSRTRCAASPTAKASMSSMTLSAGLHRTRASIDRLEGTFSGRRFCRRRNSETSARSRAAERLRRTRGLLGLVHRARSRWSPRQHRTIAGVVRRGKIIVTRARGLSTRRSKGRAQGNCRTAGNGQNYPQALDERRVRIYDLENSSSLSLAATRCYGRMWVAIRLRAAASIAASSVNPRAAQSQEWHRSA